MLSAKHLIPKKNGHIRVSINTDNLVGEIQKHVQIYSNDPEMPVANVTVHAFVEQEFVVSEATVVFLSTELPRVTSKVISITVLDNRNIQLTSVISTDPNVQARLIRGPKESEKRTNVQITEQIRGKSVKHSGMIVISTTSIYKPKINVQVIGTDVVPTVVRKGATSISRD